MEKCKLDDLLCDLREADRWLTSLGLSTRNDRFRQSIIVVEKAVEGIKTARRTGQPAKIGHVNSYHFGLVEALELRTVYLAFSSANTETVRPILRRALSGPFQPFKETRENAAGRNAMFELALAAEWKLKGGVVDVGEPDITLDCSETSFIIECKRPWHQHSIRSNIKDAAKQVAIKTSALDTHYGVVALSASVDQESLLFIERLS